MAETTQVNLPLLQGLSDGQFHSGKDLAEQTGCTRSTVWQQIRQLRTIPGIQIDAVTGRGYRLREPLDLLDQAGILQHLTKHNSQQLEQCDVLAITESTNLVAAQHTPTLHHARAWFAEYQTAGRGRRGRQWVGGFGRHLQFSLAYQFALPMAQLAGLSIAAGAVLVDLLAQLGVRDVGLKWPNDLLHGDKKLAGILLEVNGEISGPSTAVIGIGLNIAQDQNAFENIARPVASLQALGHPIERNQLAGQLLDRLIGLCGNYARHGLQPYLATWRLHDIYQGQAVELISPNQIIQGTYIGLADDGGLLLEIAGETRTLYAGEVSLRAVPR